MITAREQSAAQDQGVVQDLGVAQDLAVAQDQAAGELLAGTAIGQLVSRGESIAVAESLTGGMLAAALTSVPGASAVFRGALVTYATDLKASLLDVSADLLARCGAVHPEVAAEMAAGVSHRLDATAGVATTGVAGPDPADGHPVGTVFIAVHLRGSTSGQALMLTGGRRAIRVATVRHALALLISALREDKG
ncbi:MAG TPA: nicotinamide-nucleotide amidohydrolase family protein [Streptosporangiaceae bacterium]|nr:nicotinamide-nucleotide amidohydrolase family protein [Streptosporangiaceae bacterium]